VQARTQQLTASEGQSGLLLFRAHGRNLAAGRHAAQDTTKMGHNIRRCAFALLAPGLICPVLGLAQRVEFKVTWTTIGEVVSTADNAAATIQRGTKIARVDVQPAIVEVAVGKQVCIGSLQVRAFSADGKPVAGAPLSIAVREDHKQQLQLTHSKDICMRPARSGEYPIRFTSKLPAADDTLRGAQIFLRAS
jgi:hypothetical protein